MSARDHTQEYNESGRSKFRNFLIAIAAFIFIYAIISLQHSTKMELGDETSDPNVAIPIEVIISDVSSISSTSASPSVKLGITLHNTSPDKPVTFLRWSSPLDPKAAAMGRFVFTSKKSGKPARCLDLKLNRKIPASGAYSPDDTIHIEAGGSISRDVEIRAPEVQLEEGETYSIIAKGWWMHVQIGDHTELKNGQDGMLMGDFESKPVEFEVPK